MDKVTSLEISGIADGVKSALTGRMMRVAPAIIEIALVAILAVLVILILYRLLAPLPTPKGELMAAASVAAPVERGLVVKNPFPANAVAIDQNTEAAPDLAETSLDLRLTGVWPGDAVQSAIIEAPNGEQKRYIVGDEIVNGVALFAVYSDQVIIEQNGAREALRFENKAVIAGAIQADPTEQEAQTSVAFVDMVRVAPGADSEGVPAITLAPGRNRAAFDDAGLREGDILRTINGAAPSLEPAALRRLMEEISRAGEARLVVERDGRRVPINLSMSQSGTE